MWPTPLGGAADIVARIDDRRWFPDIATLRRPAALLAVALVALTVGGNFAVTAMSANREALAGALGLVILALGVVGYPVAAVLASRRWGSGRVGIDLGARFRAIDLAIAPGAAVTCFGVVVACGVAFQALGVPQTSNLEDFEGHLSGPVLVFLVVLSGLLAPITEELLFRGVLLRSLATRWGPGTAVVAQGIVFGAAHLLLDGGWGNVGLVVPLAGVGIVLGFVARATGRLGPTMLAHSLYNLVQVAILVATTR